MVTYPRQTIKKPILFMMIGLPGSGKSTLANDLYIEEADKTTTKPVVHSSDQLRLELFGNEDVQDRNQELFVTLHKRIKQDLLDRKDVVYDATNIDKKQRISFLAELKKIPCYRVCISVMTPYYQCVLWNKKRDRRVPDKVIKKMYKKWAPPEYREGFDDIQFSYNYGSINKNERYNLVSFFEKIDDMDQGNSHHALTLGNHCREAANYIMEKYPRETMLYFAALLHDCGKPFTKSIANAKGEVDGECHYYQHHCVGAYDSLFFTDQMRFQTEQKVYISNLIYYHMHPYNAWKQSEKAKARDRVLLGEKLYKDIWKLHTADERAH